MHKTSHKFKPKIRIIHIFAPQIIKTDVANFRELVQRLTGKPTGAERKGIIMKKKTQKLPLSRSNFIHHANKSTWPAASLLLTESGDPNIKEEENESSSTNFFDGFTDIDGFIQELIK
ncbi:hypothetical protein Pint_24119 [Pistacia integerrima]|uniref:Uncharacterized protein n=1 Tax=Pistacia integerrima TaxID=434235 RepID=A0ACC0YHZ8_9ROSI|nr:hypothetical protein Pint_24119 [Pistacia integerrima]